METKCLIIEVKVNTNLKRIGGGGPGFVGVQHIPVIVGEIILIPLAVEKAIPVEKFTILAETKRKDPNACACCSSDVNDYEGIEKFPNIQHFNALLNRVHAHSFEGMNRGTAPGEWIWKQDLTEQDRIENEVFC